MADTNGALRTSLAIMGSVGFSGIVSVILPDKRAQLFLTEIVMAAPGGNSDVDTNVALGTRGTSWNRIRMPV